MPSRLQGRIAAITGTSSGLGREIALQFSREGASVVCSDISEIGKTDKGESYTITTHDLIKQEGGKVIYVKCDTQSAEEIERLVKKAVEEFGRVDIMVNNAGVAPEATNPQPVWSYPVEQFDRTIAINLRGVWLGCKYASEQMIKQEPLENGDRGWIINMASALGLVGQANTIAYVASKHGVMGITKSAAVDCAKHRVHVNALCPGYIGTALIEAVLQSPESKAGLDSLHPFGGLGTPQDIAKAALFLASDEASWVTGIGLSVDGGYVMK